MSRNLRFLIVEVILTVCFCIHHDQPERICFSPDTCNWTFSPPWEVSNNSFLPRFAGSTTSQLDGEGVFLIAQGKFGVNQSGDLTSSWLEGYEGSRIISYTYSKMAGAAKLEVLLREMGVVHLVDSVTLNSRKIWNKRTSILPAVKNAHQIIFRVLSIYDSSDYVAIDSVRIETTSHTVIATDSRTTNSKLSIRSEKRHVRRAEPEVELSTNFCKALRCTFNNDSCSWNLVGFRSLKGKIVNEAEGAGAVISQSVLIPKESYFQINLFTSDLSSVRIYQNSGQEKSLIWSQGGIALPGWNILRIPLKFTSQPSSVRIETETPKGSFVAISNLNLLDNKGMETSCGPNLPVIQPRRDKIVRLTAVQRIQSLPSRTAASNMFPVNQKQDASLPIAPAVVSSGGDRTQPSMIKSLDQTNAKSDLHLSPSKSTATFHHLRRLGSNAKHEIRSQGGRTTKAQNFNYSDESDVERQPIQAVIKQKHGLSNKELSLLSSLPSSLNGVLASKISEMLDLPSSSGAESRPFSRSNMDYIVQNAFNAYMKSARP